MSNETQESTEVNVDVNTTEDTQGNIHSFDDLDSMTSTKSDTEVMKEAVKEAAKEKEEAGQEAKPEVKAKEEAVEEHKSNSEKTDDLADDITEEIVEEIKMIQAKRAEQGYDVPADAVFIQKVDGEEREVTLQSLLDDFSGREKWEPAFKDLNDREKAWSQEKAIVENYVNTFVHKLNNGTKMEALEYFAEIAKQDPLEFRKALRADIIREYQEYMQMTPEQQQMFEREEKVNYLERKQASEQERITTEQAQFESERVLKNLQDTLGMSDEDLNSVIADLDEHYEGKITEQVIKDYWEDSKAYNVVEKQFKSFDEDLLKNENLVNTAIEIARENPQFTDEDWKEVLSAVKKPNTRKSTSKKLKGEEVKEEKKEQSDIVKNASKLDQFYDFDQLDD